MKDITPKQTALPAVFKKIPAVSARRTALAACRHRRGCGQGRALDRRRQNIMNSFRSAKSAEV